MPNPNAATTQRPVSLAQLTQPYIKTLIYSAPGVGKTILSCTSQRMPTFMFDVDDGAISAKAWHSRRGTNPDYVHVWPVNTYADFIAGFNYLGNHLSTYQLVVVDTATELQQIALDELRNTAGIDVASKREWGIVFTMMDKIARSFHHLPTHVIWTCHEAAKDNEQFHRLMYQPAFQGQFGGFHYAKHFSEIWRYCLIEQQVRLEDNRIRTDVQRVLKCHPDQFTVAKDRSLGLAEYETPDIDYLFSKMVDSIIANRVDISTPEEDNDNETNG